MGDETPSIDSRCHWLAHTSRWRPTGGPLELIFGHWFGPYFAGKILAATGIWVFSIVAAIAAYEITGSATVVGAVTVAQFAPQLALAPYFGAVADGRDRRRVLLIGWSIATCGPAVVAVLASAGQLEGARGVVGLIVGAGVLGLGMAVGVPAMQALVPTLVSRAQLPAAVSLSVLPQTVGRAAGPALGAALALRAGWAVTLWLAALANLVFVLLMLGRRWSTLPGHPQMAAGRQPLTEGIRRVAGERALRVPLLGVAIVGFGADPAITLAPVLSDAFGRGTDLTGAFASAFGIGAAAALVLQGTLVRRAGLTLASSVGLALLATGTGAAAFASTSASAVAAFVLAGAGMMIALSALTTQLQRRAPDAIRGRVMALWAVAFLGSRPLAAALNGAVADVASVEVAFLVVALVVGVSASVVNGVPGRRANNAQMNSMDQYQLEGTDVKRVVTRRGVDGQSVIAAVGESETVVRFGPGFEVHELWRLDDPPSAVVAGYAPENYVFEPSRGAVFRVVVIPPDDVVHASLERGERWGRNSPYRSTGEDYGLHATETLDLVSVISGRVDLRLENGSQERLEPGDVVVQGGAKHAWRNPGPDPLVLHVVMIGVGHD